MDVKSRQQRIVKRRIPFDTKNETSNFDFKPMTVEWDMFGDVGIYSYLVHFLASKNIQSHVKS
jgi:hypothetical protein